jgi:DNA anti-recombination protein RmuC
MEAMRQDWNDDRIDDLDRKVDEGFRHIDQRFEQVDKRFERVENQLDSMRGEMNARFESLENGVRGLHRTLVVFSVTMLAALVGLVGAFLTAVLIQL